MALQDRLEAAMRAAAPALALRGLVQDLAREGHSKAEIRGLLETFLDRIPARPGICEADEDAILDALDALTGWCHPATELLPDKPIR